MQQAVDAAQVDERAVVGDVLDDALDDRAFLQRLQQLLRALRPCDASSTARRDTTTLLRLRSSLMTLNSSVLPSYGVVSLTGRMSTSEPGRNARMPLIMTVRPPLTLPLTVPVTISPFHRFFEVEPRREALGLVARQDGVAVAVFERFDRDGDEVADLDFEFALVVLEFFDGDESFGLEAGVDDHEVVVDDARLRR